MKKTVQGKYHTDPQFNMTPMIDIVFFLIIFFMLICQFIVQDNYRLVVPDDCPGVIVDDIVTPDRITVNVYSMPDSVSQNDYSIVYLIGTKEFIISSKSQQANDRLLDDMTSHIAELVDRKSNQCLYLRADSSIAYDDVKDVLVASARAGISSIRIAAFAVPQKDAP